MKTMVDTHDISTIRQLLKEEQDAVISYTERATTVSDPEIKAVLLDIAREEKVHSGELMQLLDSYDPQEQDAVEEGREEVDEMDAQEAWEDFEKTAKSNNQTSIEDKIDVLLAQQNEISTDTERIADLVPEMLADEEEQKEIDDIEDEEGIEDSDDPYAMLDDFDDGDFFDEGEDEEESVDESDEGEDEMDEETDVVIDDDDGEDEEPDDDGDFDEDEDVVIDDDSEEESDEDDDSDSDGDDDADDESEDVDEEEEEVTEDEEVDEEESEDEPEEEESDEEESEEEDEDEDEDEEKTKKSANPITKTIRSVSAKTPYKVITKHDRPPESMTYGHASSHDGIAKMISDYEPDSDYGYGHDPHDVVAKDWEVYELMKKLPML